MANSNIAVQTGLGKIFYSIIDDKGAYGVPKELGDLIAFNVNPSENSVSLWAGDRQVLIDSSVSVEGSFIVPQVTNQAYQDLFGYKKGTKGELIFNSKASRPNVALLVQQNLYGGVRDYITVYKSRLDLAGINGNSKTENVTFGQKEMAFKVLQEADGVWMSVMSTDDPDFVEGSETTFFTTAPVKPVIKA